MTDVLVVGALHLDVVVDAQRLPEIDETLVGNAVAYRLGGKAGNQALAAQRIGADVALAGRVGSDRFGEDLLAALDAGGVDRTQVSIGPGASGMSVAIMNEAGDYGAVIVSGENRALRSEDISLPAPLPVLLLQNEIPEAVNAGLVERADQETIVILNAAPARRINLDLLARVDLLVVNRIEAMQMLGTAPAITDPKEAVERLHKATGRAFVLTLGADGVCARSANELVTLPAPQVSVASTHGAGDAFCGALAAELSHGTDFAGALAFAQAAAALAVSTTPEKRGGLDRETAERFLAQSSSL